MTLDNIIITGGRTYEIKQFSKILAKHTYVIYNRDFFGPGVVISPTKNTLINPLRYYDITTTNQNQQSTST
jgi:hypothetical protein